MKSTEKWAVAAICLILVVAFSNYFYRTTALKHMDSVFLFESTLSIIENGQPASRTVSSLEDTWKTFSVPPESVCAAELKTKDTRPYNVIHNHAYTALYPISLLVALAGPEQIFAFLNALAHVLLLIVPFVYLRTQGASVLQSAVFLLCVALYPPWAYSAVGDYYLDRLYMPFALLSLYFMHAAMCANGKESERRLLIGFIASAITAALFTERAAIMLMAECAFFILFFPQARKSPVIRNALLGLIALLVAYLFIYFKLVYVGLEGGGGLLDNAVWNDLLRRLRAPGLPPFVLVNLLVLGVLVLFAGLRYSVLVVGAMLPNFLITIGGAELNGWSTHYHAMYLPFIIFAASIGYLQLMQRFNTGNRRVALPLIVGIYALVVIGFLNPYTGKFEKNFLASVKSGVIGTISRYYFDPQSSYERSAAGKFISLDGLVPYGSKVSAIEGVMPTLYRSRFLSLYPIDMDGADYLVISGLASGEHVSETSGATSYLGQIQVLELNRCLTQRITKDGFSLLREVPGIGVLVFRRN